MRPNPAFWKRNRLAYCGTDIAGGYVYIQRLFDVATGWTECIPPSKSSSGNGAGRHSTSADAIPFSDAGE